MTRPSTRQPAPTHPPPSWRPLAPPQPSSFVRLFPASDISPARHAEARPKTGHRCDRPCRRRGPPMSTTAGASSATPSATKSATPTDAPLVSIVIPVYNEEGILHSAVVDLRERLAPFGWNYEIILAENGSQGPHRAIGHRAREEVPRGPLLLDRRAQLRQGAEARHPGSARRVRDVRRDRPVRHRLSPARARAPRRRARPTW